MRERPRLGPPHTAAAGTPSRSRPRFPTGEAKVLDGTRPLSPPAAGRAPWRFLLPELTPQGLPGRPRCRVGWVGGPAPPSTPGFLCTLDLLQAALRCQTHDAAAGGTVHPTLTRLPERRFTNKLLPFGGVGFVWFSGVFVFNLTRRLDAKVVPTAGGWVAAPARPHVSELWPWGSRSLRGGNKDISGILDASGWVGLVLVWVFGWFGEENHRLRGCFSGRVRFGSVRSGSGLSGLTLRLTVKEVPR